MPAGSAPETGSFGKICLLEANFLARLRLDRSWAEGARPRLGSGGDVAGAVPGHGPARIWLRDPETKPAFGLLFHFDALRRRAAESGAGRTKFSFRATLHRRGAPSSAHRAALRKRTRSLTPSRAGFRVHHPARDDAIRRSLPVDHLAAYVGRDRPIFFRAISILSRNRSAAFLKIFMPSRSRIRSSVFQMAAMAARLALASTLALAFGLAGTAPALVSGAFGGGGDRAGPGSDPI
jgi:hypothetical protein